MIQHKLKLTDDTPKRCKPYPLPYAMREELQNEVDSMLEMGVTSPSTSPYASAIIMVKKMDGYRVCVDFKKLNKITQALDAFVIFLRISGLRVNIEKTNIMPWEDIVQIWKT